MKLRPLFDKQKMLSTQGEITHIKLLGFNILPLFWPSSQIKLQNIF